MRRAFLALLLLPLPALADTPAPSPAPMPAAQRGTEDMVLQLVRMWQQQEILKEQAMDAIKDAQQKAAASAKESQDKDLDLKRKDAHIFELEELTQRLQIELAQLQKSISRAPSN
jgi:hypothetical protein